MLLIIIIIPYLSLIYERMHIVMIKLILGFLVFSDIVNFRFHVNRELQTIYLMLLNKISFKTN